MIDPKLIAKVPKVELHDHLDGGLRPQTVIELARENNVALPSYDAGELKEVFVRGCRQKSLSLLNTVLHVYGTHISIDALLEIYSNLSRALVRGSRLHISHVLYAVDTLFQRYQH